MPVRWMLKEKAQDKALFYLTTAIAASVFAVRIAEKLGKPISIYSVENIFHGRASKTPGDNGFRFHPSIAFRKIMEEETRRGELCQIHGRPTQSLARSR
jgi:hypothetical protein